MVVLFVTFLCSLATDILGMKEPNLCGRPQVAGLPGKTYLNAITVVVVEILSFRFVGLHYYLAPVQDLLGYIMCEFRMLLWTQILPQLLYYFGVKNDADSLDWATIVIYTCADSCEGSVSYKEEFAWVQLALLGANVA